MRNMDDSDLDFAAEYDPDIFDLKLGLRAYCIREIRYYNRLGEAIP